MPVRPYGCVFRNEFRITVDSTSLSCSKVSSRACSLIGVSYFKSLNQLTFFYRKRLGQNCQNRIFLIFDLKNLLIFLDVLMTSNSFISQILSYLQDMNTHICPFSKLEVLINQYFSYPKCITNQLIGLATPAEMINQPALAVWMASKARSIRVTTNI